MKRASFNRSFERDFRHKGKEERREAGMEIAVLRVECGTLDLLVSVGAFRRYFDGIVLLEEAWEIQTQGDEIRHNHAL
jgi:hypothetical protein